MSKMPALFIGHGSPMNAIEENKFSRAWKALGKQLPKPEAILSVSAHWFTNDTKIMTSENPKTIYDMYGFPEELFKIVYKAKGSPHFASMTKDLISRNVIVDNSWGFDHGTWAVLHRMYPEADIPVFQLSVDRNASPIQHYQIGQELRKLREQGVIILGSGNVVHNLRRINWDMENKGFSWAEEFDDYIMEKIMKRKDEDIINFQNAGDSASLAFTTLDHYAPLLYVLGASDYEDTVTVITKDCVLGSLSMTSYLFE